MLPHIQDRRHIIQSLATILTVVSNNDNCRIVPSQSMNLEKAFDFIDLYCPSTFKDAVIESGCFLYRGEEGILQPTFLAPPPDLLESSTYNDDNALVFFSCLERELKSSHHLARPSTGHIGTSNSTAAEGWGNVVSIWPAGSSISYVFPMTRTLFFPGTCQDDFFVVNRDLPLALKLGKEVLFATQGLKYFPESSFLAIPATYDLEIHQKLVERFESRW
jgi:hypothetical protein